ncbi:uncharacterized protein LOC130988539 [Salvia miltiorrhiza]|uniref:uncharacterized protein LOC130988539 n=1 Tax=Salvia miltiorrhiza TaxID=226208 RepID=UPI0025AB67EC|nr:uncharacterized protein LOC130988539 [Salvia miltiorrhiza]
MASNMLPFRPLMKPATTFAHDQKSPKWWAPLFGFSSEPDYMNPVPDGKKGAESEWKPAAKTRLAPGCFTEEKARQFRKMTCDASSFHETMYHSAIASRLASDFSDRSAAA